MKDFVSICEICCTFTDKQQKETLHPHDVPDRPWANVGTDLFTFDNKQYIWLQLTITQISGKSISCQIRSLKLSYTTLKHSLQSHHKYFEICGDLLNIAIKNIAVIRLAPIKEYVHGSHITAIDINLCN